MNAIASYNTEVHGWKALVLENEQLRVTTLPGYGGWIYSIIYKPRDTEMLWHSSRGVIHRDDAPVVSDPLQQYKARSPGAWPEIFPHGSSAVKVGGVTIPFHGEVVSRAWRCEILESQGERVSARLTVDCHLMPLRLERTMILESGSPVLRIEETVTNLCGQKVDFMWGHHPIFGKPLLGEGSRIHAPAGCTLGGDYSPGGWPDRDGRDMSLAPQENSGISDMFYLSKLSAGWVAINNPEVNLGAALSWDLEVFPCVWIWRDAGGARDWPYFGRAYTTALEPFSALPGARERGEKLLELEGGASLSTALNFTAFEGLETVNSVSADGTVS